MFQNLRKVIFLTLLALPAYGGEFQLRYGVGIFLPDAKHPAEVKNFSIAHQQEFAMLGVQKTELGFWADSRKDQGRSDSAYGSYSVGLRVNPEPLYIEALWGVALISTPDVFLSGHFQFTQDLGIGFKDHYGRAIGVSYKHLSNAGIMLPNKGRDMFLIQIGIPAGDLW